MKPCSSLCSVLLTLFLAASCASTSSGPPATPERVAAGVLTALDAGRHVTADEEFERLADDPEGREAVYPVLFDTARAHYDAGEIDASVTILRFMAGHYPDAVAVREALCYGLFRVRADQTQAPPELLDEIDENLAELRRLSPDGPVWLSLVETQQAIDRERLADARGSFDRFLAGWNGSPPTLVPYVEDINRYLSSH